MALRTLNVTAEHIETAIPRDSSHCMIADAIRASMPEAHAISVDLQTIRFTDSKHKKRYTYLTPRVAQEALVRFDQGRLVQPFQVQLRNPQVTRSGNKKHNDPAHLEKPESGRVPRRMGGKTPPKAALSNVGRRRSFGLRSLDI